jgi:outer membrane protein assembly factor BamD
MRAPFFARLAVAGLLGLAACATNPLKQSENPEIVYNEAVRLLDRRDYLEAAEFLQEVRRRFPQSRFAVLAELKSADLDFVQDNFIEAAAGYGVFVELYPNHAEAPYALYRRALSYFNAAPKQIARDQSSAADAADTARHFLRRYPQSPLKSDVEEIFQNSRLKLAEKEAYVARFYRKKRAHEASLRRWRALSQNYSDVQSTDQGAQLLEEARRNIAELESRTQGESQT